MTRPTITDQRVAVEIMLELAGRNEQFGDRTKQAVSEAIGTLKFIEGNTSLARALATLASAGPVEADKWKAKSRLNVIGAEIVHCPS